MTEETPLERLVSDESRRSFMKKGAVATVGASAAVSGAASAQEGGDGADGTLTEGWKGLMFANHFQPGARFTFVSGVIEWTPNYGDVQDSYFSDYNTRMIRWLNTGETVPLFVAQEANVGQFDQDLGFVTDVDDDPNQPQVFEVNQEFTPFDDNQRLVTVNASPVAEDEEDAILENQDWWRDGADGAGNGGAGGGGAGGNGTATGGNGTATGGNGTATGTPGNETDGGV